MRAASCSVFVLLLQFYFVCRDKGSLKGIIMEATGGKHAGTNNIINIARSAHRDQDRCVEIDKNTSHQCIVHTARFESMIQRIRSR